MRTVYLGDHLEVALGRHIRVRPGVHGNVVALVERGLELLRIVDDVAADHEVGDGLLVGFEEGEQGRRCLRDRDFIKMALFKKMEDDAHLSAHRQS